MEADLFASVEFHVDPIARSVFLLTLANADLKLMIPAQFISEKVLLEAEFIGTVPSLMGCEQEVPRAIISKRDREVAVSSLQIMRLIHERHMGVELLHV
jgi:hypothetical protein